MQTDFGERIPTGDAVYFDGSDHAKMHNFYPYLYNKVTFEVLEKTYGKNNAALFARSATAGVQQFPVHWGGDPFSTFEAMAETLRGGLSLGLCGYGYWAHDIGGFEGNPDPALYKRWIAFGLLSSHSRLHGSGSYRVPWLIDSTEEASAVLRKFVNLKHTLMPYLYSSAIQSHKTGLPMLRAPFLEFPEDRSTWHLDTQYFLGDSLLVAPVFNAEGTVEYYLPKGKWYGLLDDQVREGPGYVVEKHGFDSLPLLLRPGKAVIQGKGGKHVVYDWAAGFRLLINPTDGMNVDVEIPDHENLGQVKAIIKVEVKDSLARLNILKGAVVAGWSVKIAGQQIQKEHLGIEGKGAKEIGIRNGELVVRNAELKSFQINLV